MKKNLKKLGEFISSNIQRIAIFIMSIIILSSVAYGAQFANQAHNIGSAFEVYSPAGVGEIEGEELDPEEVLGSFVNIAFLGFDESDSREDTFYRPDTLFVASIDIEKNTVDVINIPRDSYVQIANRGGHKDKINHAFYYGQRFGDGVDIESRKEEGLRYTMETMSWVLSDIPIHNYVTVDMDGAEEIIDLIGGVEFYVPGDVYNYRGTRKRLQQGKQVLDGEKFMYLARDRTSLNSNDFERIEMQNQLMKAAFEQMMQANMIPKIPQLYRQVNHMVDTDLTVAQITALTLVANQIDLNNDINFHTLRGSTARDNNGISYVMLDEHQRVSVIKEVFGIESSWRTIVMQNPWVEEDHRTEEKDDPTEENDEHNEDVKDQDLEEDKDGDKNRENDETGKDDDKDKDDGKDKNEDQDKDKDTDDDKSEDDEKDKDDGKDDGDKDSEENEDEENV
ncbi:LCP family protein [Proteinivorax tanatarense]|uniref:LCP family protein n=1 Tax=Proteinivorax tanatarense TaxID=1260629 RepID=A0AAU7VJB7_9FIRM